MEKHYAEIYYIQDLEDLIKDHELQLLNVSAEQKAAQGFELKIKAECEFAEDIKKIDADENFESDQTLELSEKLIFSWQKMKWLRERIAECESKKEKLQENCINFIGNSFIWVLLMTSNFLILQWIITHL